MRAQSGAADLLYSTYLGGSGDDWASALAVDGAGNAYVAGGTSSPDFPTTAGAFDRTNNGGGDAFVAKLTVGGSGAPTPTPVPTPMPTPTPTATISGRVLKYRYDAAGRPVPGSGQPVAGVTITNDRGQSATTDASGSFTLRVPAGTHTLRAIKGAPGTPWSFRPASRVVTVADGQTLSGIEFQAFDRPPVVLVHGLQPLRACNDTSPPNAFGEVATRLREAGLYVVLASLQTSSCGTPPIAANVAPLREAIERAKEQTGQPQVILVAHSMGGLVARAYIEGQAYGGDVAELFTFGTPHQGVSGGVLARLISLAVKDKTVLYSILCSRSKPGAAGGDRGSRP